MKTENNIKAIFFDVGGVCLTNGWDETEKNHDSLFEDFEQGDILFENYIEPV